MPPAAETRSISSCLLAGEKVMLAGVSDPAPDVAERLVQATGAQVSDEDWDGVFLSPPSFPLLCIVHGGACHDVVDFFHVQVVR